MTEAIPDNFPKAQSVCTACGYNMIGEQPEVCPFCGATHDHFMAWEAAEAHFRVTATPVTDGVTQLLSVPKLGLEHAAYRVDIGDGHMIWIDAPSAFNRDLQPVTEIYFTHKDFLGASNQYRALWQARVHLHADDAALPEAAAFPVDDAFSGDFRTQRLEAFHLGGHSPGFTTYFVGDVLFACDYVFARGGTMRLNPFGPRDETLAGARRLFALAAEHQPAVVCGFNYVRDGREWLRDVESLLREST